MKKAPKAEEGIFMKSLNFGCSVVLIIIGVILWIMFTS